VGPTQRIVLCGALLTSGLCAQAALQSYVKIDRPPLRQPLSTIPMSLGDWDGNDEPMHPKILAESQATEYLNRIYANRKQPGAQLWLWINYSKWGDNLRHSPEICLPSGGWTKVESLCHQTQLRCGDGSAQTITRLGYSQGELVQELGFWYYIFGEGRMERWVRNLPITSRSSHGHVTRGSSMTIEIFCPGDSDPDGQSIEEFARHLLPALEPILPLERAEYHVP
jgi:hypothetical protein